MNKQEEKLFNKIQNMVEELPWDHKTNLEYYETCVHEAAHGVVSLVICKKFDNPEDLNKLNFEIFIHPKERTVSGIARRWHGDKNRWLFSTIPVAIDKIRALSGAVLTDEFFATYYKFNRIFGNNSKLKKEYLASSDFNKAEHYGILGTYIDQLILRVCYKDVNIRLLHLELIYAILKGHGLFIIDDPEKYVNKKEL